MSFWSQLNSDARRLRPTTTTNLTNRNGSNLFRESSPETESFFDNSHANMTFPRSNLAERWGSTVFDDFPSRRTRTGFTIDSASPFGSLHRHRHSPRWMSGDRGSEGGGSESREASPACSEGSNARRQSFHGTIPVHVTQSSRSSTPDSTGSGSASGRSEPSVVQSETTTASPPHGVEENSMANSKQKQQSFTARRTPKVHHIPIHVEPRDGPHPVTMTPPVVHDMQNVEKSSTTGPSFPRDAQEQGEITTDVTVEPLVAERVIPIQVITNERKSMRRDKVQSKGEAKSCNINDEKQIGREENAQIATPPRTKSERKRKTPLEIVEDVCTDVEKLRLDILKFEGTKGDKDYLFLDEMLTRNLIRLDNIETEGNDGLRQARRAAVTAIQECIRSLEQKAQSNDDTKMESESIGETEQPESNDVIIEDDTNCDAETTAKEPGADEEVQMESESAVDESKAIIEEIDSQNLVDSGSNSMQVAPAEEEAAESKGETEVSQNETVSS